jgi:hypothetical protein
MSLSDFPYWIERILTIGFFNCAESGFVSFRQDALRRLVLEAVDSYDNGKVQLREACLQQLSNPDDNVIINALSALFVIGEASDVDAVKPLAQHSSPIVQKNARVCIFELRHRVSEGS